MWPHHLECCGFILEIFKEDDVVIYYDDDPYDWFTYFKKNGYKFTIVKLYRDSMHEKVKNEINLYDRVINLNSHLASVSYYHARNKDKVWEIYHGENLKKRDYNKHIKNGIKFKKGMNILRDRPYKREVHIAPMYNYNKTNVVVFKNMVSNRRRILFMGWCGKMKEIYAKNFTLPWQRVLDYDIDFFITVQGSQGRTNRDLLMRDHRVFYNLKSGMIPYILKDVKYIMIRPMHEDCHGMVWSGAITLAFAHNIPIIISNKKKRELGVPGIGYNYQYNEVYDRINKMSLREYKLEVDKIKLYKEYFITWGRKILRGN